MIYKKDSDIKTSYYTQSFNSKESYYWIGKFEKDYEVDDSNIIYTAITGETAIASGYFLIKNANKDIVDHTIDNRGYDIRKDEYII